MFCYLFVSDSCTNGGENKWTTKTDVHLNNGYLIIAARTLDACRQSCVSNPDCNAIDYKGSVSSGKCWIFIYLKDPQLLPESGTIHETLERCVLLAEGKYNANKLCKDMMKYYYCKVKYIKV